MRHLGIDFGSKKIGVAVSDEEGNMAFPLTVIPNDRSALDFVRETSERKHVQKIVIGHSLALDGAENKIQEQIDAFAENLRTDGIAEVVLEPEQFSTQEALRIQGRTDKTDASAAAVILNSYLTRMRNNT